MATSLLHAETVKERINQFLWSSIARRNLTTTSPLFLSREHDHLAPGELAPSDGNIMIGKLAPTLLTQLGTLLRQSEHVFFIWSVAPVSLALFCSFQVRADVRGVDITREGTAKLDKEKCMASSTRLP